VAAVARVTPCAPVNRRELRRARSDPPYPRSLRHCATSSLRWPARNPYAIVYGMGATPISSSLSSTPQKDPPGNRRAVSGRLVAALEAKYLNLHAQLIAANRPMSGRAGGYVYYWAYGRLCWRRHVIPKDPRTPAQQSSRAAFGAASKAWSENQGLTQEHRDAWHADAAKLRTRPRLAQSGPLTVQQHYVGRNAVKGRWDLPLLLEPPKRERKNAESATQVPHAQRPARPSAATRRACAAPAPSLPHAASAAIAPHASRITHHAPSLPRAASAAAKAAIRPIRPSQVLFPQRLTRPSSDRPHTTTIPLPVQYRWQAQSLRSIASSRSLRFSSIAHARPNARFRELWRGG